MKLDIVPPKNETEKLLLSVSKKWETFIKPTHTKPQVTLEFKLTKRRETYSIKAPIPIERCWIKG